MAIPAGIATLTHLKSVAVLSDPLNNTSNPKSILGALQV